MSAKPYVAPLAAGELVYTPGKPAFSALATQMLGNAGDTSDGFDGALSTVLRAFDALDALTKSINTSLAGLDAAQKVLEAIPNTDITSAINKGIAADRAASVGLDAAIAAIKVNASNLQGLAPAPLAPTYSVAGIGVGQTGTVPLGSGSGVSLTQPVLASTLGLEAGSIAALSEGLVTSGTALAATLGAVATFAPIVGAFVGLALLLKQFVGKGCGSACIESAKAEQIYEAMADNLLALFKLGMITKNQATGGMALANEYGQQHLGTFNDKQSRAGAQNMQNVISNLLAGMQHTTGAKPTPFNLAVAHQNYVSGPGWYPDSLAAGAQLTDEYVSSLR